MGCCWWCIVNLLTKNQLGFVQPAENNISKLVGIFCKLSEEQFIPVHLIHPPASSPSNQPPLESWGLVGHRPHHLYRSTKNISQQCWASNLFPCTPDPTRISFQAILPDHSLAPLRVLKLQKIKWIVCQIASAQSPHKRQKKRGQNPLWGKVKTQAALQSSINRHRNLSIVTNNRTRIYGER